MGDDTTATRHDDGDATVLLNLEGLAVQAVARTPMVDG